MDYLIDFIMVFVNCGLMWIGVLSAYIVLSATFDSIARSMNGEDKSIDADGELD